MASFRSSHPVGVLLVEYLTTVFLTEGGWEKAADQDNNPEMKKFLLGLSRAGVHPRWIPVARNTSVGLYSPPTWVEIIRTWESLAKLKPPGMVLDVTRYGDLGEVASAVEKFKDTVSKTQAKKTQKSSGADKVYEDRSWSVVRISTAAASCQYGKGTKWCISGQSNNMFKSYHDESFVNFWFVTHKPSKEKFAISVPPDSPRQFFDSQDTLINQDEFVALVQRLGDSEGILGFLKLESSEALPTRTEEVFSNPEKFRAWTLSPDLRWNLSDNLSLSHYLQILPELEKLHTTDQEVEDNLEANDWLGKLRTESTITLLASQPVETLQWLQDFVTRQSLESGFRTFTKALDFVVKVKTTTEPLKVVMSYKDPQGYWNGDVLQRLRDLVSGDPETAKKVLTDPALNDASVAAKFLAPPRTLDTRAWYRSLGEDLVVSVLQRFPLVIRPTYGRVETKLGQYDDKNTLLREFLGMNAGTTPSPAAGPQDLQNLHQVILQAGASPRSGDLDDTDVDADAPAKRIIQAVQGMPWSDGVLGVLDPPDGLSHRTLVRAFEALAQHGYDPVRWLVRELVA